jgi:hypothetical protein
MIWKYEWYENMNDMKIWMLWKYECYENMNISKYECYENMNISKYEFLKICMNIWKYQYENMNYMKIWIVWKIVGAAFGGICWKIRDPQL